MTSPDQLISSSLLANLQDISVSRFLFTHVLQLLGQFLGADMDTKMPLEDVSKNGFCVEISGKIHEAMGIQVTARGIVSVREVEEQDGLLFGATLFFYFSEFKVVLRTGESFLDLEYVVNAGGTGNWVQVGWFRDIYNEYEAFDGTA